MDSVWEQKKLEARKLPIKRGESHLSGARIVRPHGWQKKPPDEKKVFGARHETRLARFHFVNTCQYYDTTAGKTPQPILTKDQRN